MMVEQAAHRARDRGLHYVDAASYAVLLLWTLIRWERKVGLVALERMGVDLERLARELDGILSRKADENPIVINGHTGDIVNERTGDIVYKRANRGFIGADYDAISQPLLGHAKQKAREMGHDYVGSEHLLLAIVEVADPELNRVLDSHLMTETNVRETILDLLGS